MTGQLPPPALFDTRPNRFRAIPLENAYGKHVGFLGVDGSGQFLLTTPSGATSRPGTKAHAERAFAADALVSWLREASENLEGADDA